MHIKIKSQKSDLSQNHSPMPKKKSWFTLVKRLFISDSHSNQEKKEKRRKWIFTRLRMKRLPSITAPSQSQPPQEIEEQNEKEREQSLSETEEKQSNRALSVAIASTAAAEAAVAAAHAAAEVVRLTSKTRSANGFAGEIQKPFAGEAQAKKDVRSDNESDRKIRESSAVKIQTAFRGYLAKKALRALKGIVTLQAIIRGRAVRRQAVTTLKRLQSIINIQSQVCANRFQTTEATFDRDDDSQLSSFRDKMLRMDSCNQRRWDDSLMSKEEADAKFLSKREAAIRRERIREYWHSHRKSAESDRKQVSGRWRYWLEQWVDTQLTKSKELEDLDPKQRDDLGDKKLKIRNLRAQSSDDQSFMNSPPVFVPRRQSHRRQLSLGDENLFASSPIVPTYMLATESAKAKARQTNSPKLRPEFLDGFSPSKNKLSLVSSIASEVPLTTSSVVMGKSSDVFHQRSPSLKGVRGPVKSSRKIKDLSFDSECSLSHWNQQSTFRL